MLTNTKSDLPGGHMQPRMAMNVAQRKVVNLFKALLSFIAKFYTKFYYLDMYICYIIDYKLGICSAILKDYQKGHCVIRGIM